MLNKILLLVAIFFLNSNKFVIANNMSDIFLDHIMLNAKVNTTNNTNIINNPNNSLNKITELPELGDFDRSLLSPSDAEFLGKSIILQLYAANQILDDYDITYYLTNLGDELLNYSNISEHELRIYLLQPNILNAFALPGYFICVYNGLLYNVDSEAELVSVLAHEISHIALHHIFRNISNYNHSQLLSIAGLLAGIVVASVDPNMGLLVTNGTYSYAIQNMLAFSRSFEQEADRLGQKIMYFANYDPQAMAQFFAKLQLLSQFDNQQQLSFLNTHPVTSLRLSEAIQRAMQLVNNNTSDIMRNNNSFKNNSISFLLIKEKSRVRYLGNKKALEFYKNILLNSKMNNQESFSKNKTYIATNQKQLDFIYYGLALVYNNLRLYNEAETSIIKVSQSMTQNPIIQSLKINILINLNRYNEAQKLVKNAIDYYPEYFSLYLLEVDLLIKSNQIQQATQLLETLALKFNNHNELWGRLAMLYSDANLDNKIKYHYALAQQLFLLMNYKDALFQYKKALDLIQKENITKDNNYFNLANIITSKISEINSLEQLYKDIKNKI